MSFPRYPEYKDSGVECLGEVPGHWEVKRFQRCVQVAEGQVDPEDARYSSMPLIAPNHVEPGTGRLLSLESAGEQGAESGKYLCNAGDVVYSKIRPALRKVCIAPEPCLCSADMYPLRAHSGLANPFLLWLMLSEQFSSLAVLESERVAMPKINRESLKEVELVVPPLVEQTAIAAFLNRETTKIDALVAEQQRLIELLKEKRQAVISHAVTKGLNPDAPMKPSGVEWLGEIPAHWEVKRLKYLVSNPGGIQMGPFGGMLLDLESEDTGYKVYGQENTISGDFGLGRRWIDETRFRELANYHVQNGDILLTRKGSLGNARLLQDLATPGIIDSDTIRVRVNANLILAQFMSLLLHRAGYIAQEIGLTKRGAILAGLNSETIANLTIVVPPLHEQQEMLEHLETEAASIDAHIRECTSAIDLLQERRTALISAAVTGQIDVRAIANRSAA